MKKIAAPVQIGMLLLIVVTAALATGCATPEAENASAKPWNAPKNWEHGVPTSIMEGR